MKTLADILQDFDAKFLPHERFFVEQGLIAFRARPEPELPPFHHANSYLSEAGAQLRLQAHQRVAGTMQSLQAAKAGEELSPSAFGELVLWALAELGLGCVESFGGFVLLFRQLAGPAALNYAPAIFAATALLPQQRRSGLLKASALAEIEDRKSVV